MSETTVQKVDVTAPGDHLSVVEILTVAGIVRVNTNLVNTQTGQPVVVVEIERNYAGRAKTAPGGEWDVEVRKDLGDLRTDVTLTKREA